MKICIVGSGGREHALAHALGRHADVVVTPGNPGIPGSVATPATEIDADLFVVGPEAPLVNGLADQLRAQGKRVFGPGADGAQLEGSKAWMKQILNKAGVPTARYGSFTDQASALAFLDQMHDLFVIKTDGLAAGKGVLVTTDRAEAAEAIVDYLSGDAFGTAGQTVVIEEGLTGPELSVLAICDGKNAVALSPAQDFKRQKDGDQGPNTGGMGAYSPVPLATEAVVEQLMDQAVLPTLATLGRQGIDYRGVLYCGLMFTPEGPKVLEYNVRFGDPETQAVLPRLTSDLGQLLASAADGQLGAPPIFDTGAAVTVVCATEGYPENPRTGQVISGIEEANSLPGVSVYCAGVKASPQGLITAGGRVLSVTGQGPSIEQAREKAYQGANTIDWPGIQRRTDIAAQPTER
ncbi:MAG: phosphoribosylamine--glycine ligase [Actinobacteria bacterium]|jgi:phosphoribosylamine--glycine ligase|nr:phosphoribosylamine--glycine ligase [Actinomycetota bacterium]MBT3969356.1 phosphoribosylamine--glycine ligase [Actinomycetota bacterium]MBT4009250.1 phosphoribosylamine--glycine ligase [Actinomycetota bacterium]MBT4302297.1 phosphoribosylamine--glycine ligase [Actinomycetota bacterium]MBT4477390.1 phosphoribosylamine--glycine ligase [Actinomycetota bacterium]